MFGSAGFGEEPELEPLWGKAELESLAPLLGSAGLNEPDTLPLRDADGKSLSLSSARRARAEPSEARAAPVLEVAFLGSDGVNGVPAESVAVTGVVELLVVAPCDTLAAFTIVALGDSAAGGARLVAESLGAAAGASLGGATFEVDVVVGDSVGVGAGSSRGARACCSYANTAPAKARQAATGVITPQRRNANGRGLVPEPVTRFGVK